MLRLISLLSLAALLTLPLVASAQVTTLPTGSPITSVSGFIVWLRVVLNWIFIIVGILAVLAILVAAILYISAGGNDEQRKKAGAWLKWGIVGVIVAIVAGSIIPIVQNILSGA